MLCNGWQTPLPFGNVNTRSMPDKGLCRGAVSAPPAACSGSLAGVCPRHLFDVFHGHRRGGGSSDVRSPLGPAVSTLIDIRSVRATVHARRILSHYRFRATQPVHL